MLTSDEMRQKEKNVAMERGKALMTDLAKALREKGHEVVSCIAGEGPASWVESSSVRVEVGNDSVQVDVVLERGDRYSTSPRKLRLAYRDVHYRRTSRPEPKDGFKVPVLVEIVEGLVREQRAHQEDWARMAENENRSNETFEKVLQSVNAKDADRMLRSFKLHGLRVASLRDGQEKVEVEGSMTAEEIARFVKESVEVTVSLSPEAAIALLRSREPAPA